MRWVEMGKGGKQKKKGMKERIRDDKGEGEDGESGR